MPDEPVIDPRAQDYVVEALKKLGGLAHLRQLYAMYGVVSGREMTGVAEAKVRQALQLFSTDATWERPKSAPDLFYSFDGVDAASGIWGLRHFSPQAPHDYPIAGLEREHLILLRRDQTTLFNMRGIAYRDSQVLGIHVDFSPTGDYPDRLLSDATIEHVGEGKGAVQTATGGNRGMLELAGSHVPIPVFQFIATDRYAPLGDYIVVSHRREVLRLQSSFDTEAYIFSLRPVLISNSEALRVVSEGDIDELASESATLSFLLAPEGRAALRTHISHERNPGNRSAVIRAKGVRCEACGFHFEERYGPEMAGFIEVHHVRPLASGAYTPSIDDFAVLCANCHRAAHKGRGLSPRTVTELRTLLQ